MRNFFGFYCTAGFDFMMSTNHNIKALVMSEGQLFTCLIIRRSFTADKLYLGDWPREAFEMA